MNVDDQNAAYLATGEGHPSGQSAKLDGIRALLGDPGTWAVPPDEVQADVLAAIQSGSPGGRSETLMAGWLPRLAAVAAIALVAVALMALWPSGTSVELIGTEIAPEASGVAVLDPTGSGWEIQVDLSDLPPAGPGKYYEGWVWSDDGLGVSIGTFHLHDAGETVTLWSGVDVSEYPSIWISLQEEGAGNEVSDEIVMRGRIEG
jgi:hypothetical protein